MGDDKKTKKQLIEELKELRQCVAELKGFDEEIKQTKANQEKFTIAFLRDSIPMTITTFKEGRFVDVSDAFLRQMGLKRDEVVGHTSKEIVFTEDQGASFLNELNKRGRIENLEMEVRTKGGALRYGLFNAVMMNINNEKYLLTVMTDITERKQAEEALRESEERYRMIFNNSPVGVMHFDANGTIIDFNDKFTHIMGAPREKILGFNMLELRDQVMVKAVKDALDGKIGYYEGDYRSVTGGKTIPMRAVYQSITADDGMFVGAVGLIEDITTRKRAEEELRESEDRYRTILENIEDGYFEVDIAGNLTFFNDSVCRMTGTTRAELMGMNYRQYTDKENGKILYQAFNEIFRTGEPSKGVDYEIIEKDGTKLYVSSAVSLIRNTSGQPIGFRGIMRNITDRKQVEEEKRSLQERLQRSEKMEALGTLAGGVAHDLNNVLGIVVGYSEMLLDGVDKSSPLRHGLENVMTGGQRAAAIVDDLLTLARRGVPGRSILNLNKIIADCQRSPEFANLSFHHPSVKIKPDIEPDLLNISGSSVHLGKSLYNLISNASEAMAKGGVVTIRTANQYLDKPVQGYDQIRAGDYVVLSVSDTGEGISSNDLKRIFEPFYTKKVMGRSGTGLGLAVVWGTVKDHNGYINVESEEGKGSTFTLYFPVTREDITAEAIAVPISEYMGKGEFILVVDDVKEQRDLAAGMLRKLNYNVVSVSSGEEAVAYMKEHEVDLMVLDMIMDPGMDGLDTYRSVLEIRPKQKAIIVSGFSESDRVRAARDLGSGAYVRKPYITEKLGLAVRKEMDRK